MKLIIQNFQSHKYSEFDFHEGVNAIVGDSRQGKSAILRAVDWLFNNKPSGDEFISHWAITSCSVTIEFDDGISVSRNKGKSVNNYELKVPGKNTQVFTGFGQSVPEAIKKVLNCQDFNFRFQHQGPFLLNMSSGDVAKYLNKIARFDIIDKTTAEIDSILREEKNQYEVEKSIESRKSEELKQYDFLNEFEEKVQGFEKTQSQLENEIQKYNQLHDLVQSIYEVQGNKEKYYWLGKRKLQVGQLTDILHTYQIEKDKASKLSILLNHFNEGFEKSITLKEITYKSNRVEVLSEIGSQIKDETRKYNLLIDLIDQIKGVLEEYDFKQKIAGQKKEVEKLLEIQKWVKEKVEKRRLLGQVCSDIDSIGISMEQGLIALELAKENHASLIPDSCPLCGADRKHSHYGI